MTHDPRASFERIDPSHAVGTSKVFSREDLWEMPDAARAFSTGDFIGRLVTLFGAPDPDGGFVLRHRATGLVVTAYSGASGPAYGGETIARASSPPGASGITQAIEDEWNAIRITMVATVETGENPSLSLLDSQRDIFRRLAAQKTKDGFVAAVVALEALVAATPLTDYEHVDDTGEHGPRRVGVRGGVPFEEPA